MEFENLSYEERLRELQLFSLEEKRLRAEISPIHINTLKAGGKKMEPSSIQWCPVTMGTKQEWTSEDLFFSKQ